MEIDFRIREDNIDEDFQRIANDLLNNWILKVENALYRIAEIEFYYSGNSHRDPYIHGNKLQKQTGKWYFHGSGIDITFGNDAAFGGILIRALANIQSNEYIYGPLVCVQELFKNFPTVFNSEINFGLIPAKENQIVKEKLIRAPRVGLNPQKDPEMWDKLYRFLVMPKQKHADKTRIYDAMKAQGFSEIECNNIWDNDCR
jgi:hypothetical protein